MKTRKKNMEHSFNIAVAMEYGILEAVIIRNFQYWISKNKANKAHFVNNHYWTYNSYDALVELFPYATKDQIKKRILRLVEKGVLIIGHFSEDSRDRTNWFAFADEARWIERNGTTNNAEKTNAECESARCINSSIDIYTNNKHTNNKPNIIVEEQQKFVRPTVEDVAAYIQEKGYDIDAETFVAYYERNGWMVGKSKMKDWKAGVRYWVQREKKSNKPDVKIDLTDISPFYAPQDGEEFDDWKRRVRGAVTPEQFGKMVRALWN